MEYHPLLLPLPYRLYSHIHRGLTALGGLTFVGRHPAIIVRNSLNRAAFATVLRRTDHFVVPVREKFVIKVPSRDQAAASILFDRQYSPSEARTLMAILGLCNSFVDVGANLGYFALLALARTADAKAVIAVEPNPALAHLIQESMELNGFRSGTTLCAAVGAQSGECDLVVNPRRSSVARVRAPSDRSLLNRVCRARVVTLNELFSIRPLDRPLVKVDVEGCEADVFRGASAALKSGSIFVSEVSSRSIPEIHRTVDKQGYCMMNETGIPYAPGLKTRMLIFAPESRMASVSQVLRDCNSSS